MNQVEARALVDGYEKLRRACFVAARADRSLFTNGELFTNFTETDITFISPQEKGIVCAGDTYTQIYGGSYEGFQFQVSYDVM